MRRAAATWVSALAGAAAAGAALRAGEAPAPSRPPEAPAFVDATEVSRVAFTSAQGKRGIFIVDVTGSGVGILDFDGDGKLDLFLPTGSRLEGFGGAPPPRCALYRGRGDGTFEEVAARAGVARAGFSMGVAAADFDNDGHTDLFVTGYGGCTLYRNRGDGTFADVTAKAGVGGKPGDFATGACWLDFDGDGLLDLYVARYVDFAAGVNERVTFDDLRVLGGATNPSIYAGQPGSLYRNKGDGTFEDVTARAGVANPQGKGLGVVSFDADGDGRPDLYIANDRIANRLYLNNGDGTFRDASLESGTAVSAEGRPQGSMGIAVADFDGDGRLDLLVTNFLDEGAALYRNLGGGRFEDVAERSGLRAATIGHVGWGVCVLDFDRDGRPDVFIGNGHVTDERGFVPRTRLDPSPPVMRERHDRAPADRSLLLWNRGGGAFVEAGAAGGAPLARPRAARGVAAADLDGDGRLDLVVLDQNAPAEVLRGTGADRNHWIEVRLRGTRSNRDGIGARVTVRAGGRAQVRERMAGSSYISSESPWLYFGLGESERVDRIEVRWPGGREQVIEGAAVDRAVTVVEPER